MGGTLGGARVLLDGVGGGPVQAVLLHVRQCLSSLSAVVGDTWGTIPSRPCSENDTECGRAEHWGLSVSLYLPPAPQTLVGGPDGRTVNRHRL